MATPLEINLLQALRLTDNGSLGVCGSVVAVAPGFRNW
jgi:hypothetical protein